MSEETKSPKPSRPPRMDSNSMGHPVFGDLLVESFPQHRLPTFLQVLNRVRFLKKNQVSNRENPLRSIYNIVANEVSLIYKEAFVLPVLNDHSLTTKFQTDIEKKLKYVQSNLRESSAMHSNAKQCEAMQSNAKQCKAMRSNAKQCKAMQSNAKTCFDN